MVRCSHSDKIETYNIMGVPQPKVLFDGISFSKCIKKATISKLVMINVRICRELLVNIIFPIFCQFNSFPVLIFMSSRN